MISYDYDTWYADRPSLTVREATIELLAVDIVSSAHGIPDPRLRRPSVVEHSGRVHVAPPSDHSPDVGPSSPVEEGHGHV